MIYLFYGCLILTISISAASISSDLFRIAEKLNSIEERLKENGDRMSRLIDAEYLLDLIKDIDGERYGYIDAEDINNAPTVDAVPVVRCKDCIHSRPDEYGLECMAHYRPTKENDFCSYGENLTGGTTNR